MFVGARLLAPLGCGPAARPAPHPRITHAPPCRPLAAQRASVSQPAARATLDYTVQPSDGLFCGAQPRTALSAPAARRARRPAAAPFCHQGGAAPSPQSTDLPSKASAGVALRTRARAKVRVSLGGEAAARRGLTRCAAQPFFFDREDAAAELKSLLLRTPTSATLLLGPKDCGKTALLRQVERELRARPPGSRRRCPPLLHIDLRLAGVTGPEALSEALRQAAIEANVWKRISKSILQAAGSVLPGSKVSGAAGPVSVEVELGSAAPSLDDMLAAFRKYFASCKAANIFSVVVLDEANKLMAWENTADVDLLLSFFVAVTKQDKQAHVVLATSDYFFLSWLAKRGVVRANVKVLGDLPEAEAKRFFCGGGGWEGLMAQWRAPPLEAGTWEEVYAVCGGNIGMLTECVGIAQDAGWSWGQALDTLMATGSEAVDTGFYPNSEPARGPAPAWTAVQYKAALRCIARAPHHAISKSALIKALGDDGDVALSSLVQYNLLALRPYSSPAWASDLPQEVYSKRLAVVTMPGPAQLRYVLSLEQCGELEEEAPQGKGGGEGGGEAASG